MSTNFDSNAAQDELMRKLFGTYNSETKQYEGGMQPFRPSKEFDYDINSDALYQQMAEQYSRQGKLAMEDAVGRASALTGGYGNSYAQTVGQQTYQSYLQDLNDAIPELYQTALNKYAMDYEQERDAYNSEYQQLLDKLGMLTSEESKVVSGGDSGGSGDSGGNGGGKATYANTLWNFTGTYDDNGNPNFMNSEGKTQAFGAGVNPYTGTKHADAKYGTFSNGYQPDNIGGTKLKNSGMSTNITGKNQTIWQANGKYWLWRGDLNKYIEVDVSELD